MLSNGLHGQRDHSLTVFVPTIKCPHYCQLAQHLYPERHQEHRECRLGCRERELSGAKRELSGAKRERERERESCLERRKRHQEDRGCRYLGLFTTGCLRLVFSSGQLGRAGQDMLFTAGWLRLVVTVDWLGYAVYGGSVTTGGQVGLFTAGWLRLMYVWCWGAGMGRTTLRNIMLILWRFVYLLGC